MEIDERMASGPLPIIADGGIGTCLLSDRDPPANSVGQLPCVEHLNLTHADRVSKVHRSYVEAGAELIVTNSFCATYDHLSTRNLGDFTDQINLAAVALARAALTGGEEETGFVLGSCGPLRTRDNALMQYRQQISALRAGGVDCLLIESVRSASDLEAALQAASDIADIRGNAAAILVSFCPIDASLRLSDGSIADMLRLIQGYPVSAVGVNCGDGDRLLHRALAAIRSQYNGPLMAMPSAGLPSMVEGQLRYPLGPEEWAENLLAWHRDFQLSIVGGCCGTTKNHIVELRRLFFSLNS